MHYPERVVVAVAHNDHIAFRSGKVLFLWLDKGVVRNKDKRCDAHLVVKRGQWVGLRIQVGVYSSESESSRVEWQPEAELH